MAYRDWGGAVIDRARGEHRTADTAVPSIVPALPVGRHGKPDGGGPARHWRPDCPEIDCIRHLLPPWIVALAELRAVEADVGADRVLVAEGVIGEETYAIALAAHFGLPFESLTGQPRAAFPLADEALIEAANRGMLPLATGDGLDFVVAPQLVDSRRLVALVLSGAEPTRRIRLTTAARLRHFVFRHGARAIERRAVEDLRRRRADLSAGAPIHGHRIEVAFAVGAAVLAAIMAPGIALATVELALGAVFLAWTALRLLGIFSEPFVRRRPRAFPDDKLPVYSIVVALHREATVVEGLVAALRRLNYPPEKLDIKLVLEPDDRETQEAIARLRLGPPFEIIIAPPSGPRTKPKALNAALPLVRGKFVAVYDAEDRPEPDQLRLALEAFVAADERLACVQARLTIDNAKDSWLTRLYAAEYAGLFDVFLPGLAAWRLPLPLGGSSNHFRSFALRKVGAWDPFNVTEDADLGMRLARFGYRSTVIASTTYEEAPGSFGPWLRQRTRWFKGWMQTWWVHMRAPRRLARELGLSGFAVFQLLVGGTVLAALVHLVFALHFAVELAAATMNGAAFELFPQFHATMLVCGYLISAIIGLIGLTRRRLLDCAWAIALMPAYWLLLSLAAWRALAQLISNPYHWEKTDHGLARTSRLAQRARSRPSARYQPVRLRLPRRQPSNASMPKPPANSGSAPGSGVARLADCAGASTDSNPAPEFVPNALEV
jgi:cellulose synthase/poly-beta-1,6-N-acetylglucosamine synthase-like glycosyltransferase